MKFFTTAVALHVGIAVARPQGTVSNDLGKGGCKKVTLIYARASTETGNMVKFYNAEIKTVLTILGDYQQCWTWALQRLKKEFQQ